LRHCRRYPHLHATTGAPDDSRIRGHGVLLIVVQDRRYELRSKLNL
jgi:hypothetical protein